MTVTPSANFLKLHVVSARERFHAPAGGFRSCSDETPNLKFRFRMVARAQNFFSGSEKFRPLHFYAQVASHHAESEVQRPQRPLPQTLPPPGS